MCGLAGTTRITRPALALAAVLAAGACSRGGSPDSAAGGPEGQQDGRIDFSRTTAFDGNILTVDLSSPGGGRDAQGQHAEGYGC